MKLLGLDLLIHNTIAKPNLRRAIKNCVGRELRSNYSEAIIGTKHVAGSNDDLQRMNEEEDGQISAHTAQLFDRPTGQTLPNI
jgi:hypothetical protein